MRKVKIIIILLISCFVQPVCAQYSQSKANHELLNLIRSEKFRLILPGAMRDNNVDMWIHAMRRGDHDAFNIDFGVDMGFVIFTDHGDRIEKVVVGIECCAKIADESLYDAIMGNIDLAKYISERDPKKIAINMSSLLTHGDGLSHTNYVELVKEIGDKYANRLVSSENVITDFRVRRIQPEIRTFANICELQRQVMETALTNIVPGTTTINDVYWWSEDQLLKNGIAASYYGGRTPRVLHSEVSKPSEYKSYDYKFQPGDLISWDWEVVHLNMGTDYKRNVYILRDGETEVPASVQHAWERGLKAREIIRNEIVVGHTAGETMKAVVAALEKAGYVYTPFEDTPRDLEIIDALKGDKKSGFSVDFHCVGNTGNSEVAVGPAFAPFRPYRSHFKIQPNHLFSFEYMVHTYVPEWGKRISINFEDNHIVTQNGVEWLYPPNKKILLVNHK
ncbi:M24 family metallopeptidase [Maribacter antarcticus]|uniref:M24 family metallopeptidase n=1 Tax=Maribacter antarcticus TaxID=505250 RepID=UPI000A50657E|nr:M24 family metallopeptidase [Maribacter antarcticus]